MGRAGGVAAASQRLGMSALQQDPAGAGRLGLARSHRPRESRPGSGPGAGPLVSRTRSLLFQARGVLAGHRRRNMHLTHSGAGRGGREPGSAGGGGAGTKSRLITSLNTRVILYITPCLSSPAPAPLRHLSFLLVLSDRASTRLRPEPSSHSAVWEDAGAVGALPGEGSPA